MKNLTTICAGFSLVIVEVLGLATPAFAGNDPPPVPIWNQQFDGQDGWGPSQVGEGWGIFSDINKEVADDFDLAGTIDRVRPKGFKSGTGANPPLSGVYVRFYEFGADNKPGALQQEYFLPVGRPQPHRVHAGLSQRVRHHARSAFSGDRQALRQRAGGDGRQPGRLEMVLVER